MYTAVLEMHIEVLQGLQKVAAYSDDIFLPEEIDFHLSKQQLRLVEEIVNKKFEDLQVGLDYIQPLIIKNHGLQVFIPQASEPFYEANMAYAVFPPDYLHLITDRSESVTSTVPPLCNDLTGIKNQLAYQNTYTEYIAALPMFVPLAIAPPYFYKTTLTVTKGGLPLTATVPEGLWNIQSKNSWFYISNYIMELPSIAGVRIYWERYRGKYYKNSFVFVTTDPTITQVALTSTISSTDVGNGGTTTANFNAGINYKIPKYTALPGYRVTQVPNLLTELDELYEQDVNVFYKTNTKNPKSVVTDNYLMTYESKSSLISKSLIDYVRTPRQISLSLNQISELGGHGPRIVVDRTIEYLKLAIENPSYQGVLQDNQLRNQI